MLTIEQMEEFVKELNDSDFGEGFLKFRAARSSTRLGVRWSRTKKAGKYILWNNAMKESDFTYDMSGSFQVKILTDEEFIERTKKDIKEIVENLKEEMHE